MAKRNRQKSAQDELAALTDADAARGNAMDSATRQLKTVAKIAVGVLVVSWLLAFGFWSGLKSNIPLYVAGGITATLLLAAFLVRRNFAKSQELGGLLSDGADLSPEQRAERLAKLQDRIDKGEAAAIMTAAQLQMQEEPRDALVTLEKANLEKGPKMIAHQVRGMRAMIHLNLGELNAARGLADDIDLAKLPDPKSRAHLVGIIAESWARSGNAIEANELLDKYDPEQDEFQDVRLQLLRARVFASAHKNDLKQMRSNLKKMEEISPQLIALFVGQKRVHPLLQKEAKKRLEKSGVMPRQRIQMARR